MIIDYRLYQTVLSLGEGNFLYGSNSTWIWAKQENVAEVSIPELKGKSSHWIGRSLHSKIVLSTDLVMYANTKCPLLFQAIV